MRRCTLAQKWLSSSFLIFSCPETPKPALYELYFWPCWLPKYSGKKWKKSRKNRSKFEKFTYTIVICLKMKLRMCTIQIQKEKVWFFSEKNTFEYHPFFFQRGDPSVKKFSFRFTKISKTNSKNKFSRTIQT